MTSFSAVNRRAISARLVLFAWIVLSTSIPPTVSLSALPSMAAVRDASNPDLPVAVGQTTPGLALPDSAGRVVTLAAYRGRPVILNFWATWCIPCRQEMPLLQQAYETHQHTGLAVLGISQDEPNRSQVVRAYWARAGLTFPTLLDSDGMAAKRYRVFILPSTIFMDAQGMVTVMHQGPLNATQLEQYLDKTMAPESSSRGVTPPAHLMAEACDGVGAMP